MKKLSFAAAICAAVFTLSTANAQVTDTTGTRKDNGTSVTQDTTVKPNGTWDKTDQDTVKGTLDNGRNNGVGTDTTRVSPFPDTNRGIGTGNNDNGIGTGTNDNDNGIGTGTNDNDNGMGTGTNGTRTNGTGTDTRTGTDNRTGTGTNGTGTDINGTGTNGTGTNGTGTNRNR